MVPRHSILSANGWDLILKEIIYCCKPYIDAELDIALERLLFTKKRPKGQSFGQFLTQLMKLREDVCNILGHEEIKCPHCEHVESREHRIPGYIWRYLIMKNCETTKEEKMLMMQWEQGYDDSERLQQLLLKLDSMNYVDAPSVAHRSEYKTAMGNNVSQSSVSNSNYVKTDQDASSNFIVQDLDPQKQQTFRCCF